jgi:hypothetical protein
MLFRTANSLVAKLLRLCCVLFLGPGFRRDECACDGAQTARCKSSSRPVTGLVVCRNCVEAIRGGEQRKTNMWRVVKRTGFGLLGWRAGSSTVKPRKVIDAERDDSSDQSTLMDGCRRDAWKFVRSKQGELPGEECRAAVRGPVVVLKLGNSSGAKGPREDDL